MALLTGSATTSLPLFISVEEAARLIGISRTLAYEMAHLGLRTKGCEGLPAIRLGRRLLVSRAGLEGLALDQDEDPGDR